MHNNINKCASSRLAVAPVLPEFARFNRSTDISHGESGKLYQRQHMSSPQLWFLLSLQNTQQVSLSIWFAAPEIKNCEVFPATTTNLHLQQQLNNEVGSYQKPTTMSISADLFFASILSAHMTLLLHWRGGYISLTSTVCYTGISLQLFAVQEVLYNCLLVLYNCWPYREFSTTNAKIAECTTYHTREQIEFSILNS